MIHFLLNTGTVCDFRLSYGRVLNRKSKIIAVNRNKSQLFKVGHFHKPSKNFVKQILKTLKRINTGYFKC